MQATPVLVPATTSSSPGAATTAPQAELDLDDLAHRLYPKLRPFLRRELWIGRERAGSATDRRSL
jgi:hypothetical protein